MARTSCRPKRSALLRVEAPDAQQAEQRDGQPATPQAQAALYAWPLAEPQVERHAAAQAEPLEALYARRLAEPQAERRAAARAKQQPLAQRVSQAQAAQRTQATQALPAPAAWWA